MRKLGRAAIEAGLSQEQWKMAQILATVNGLEDALKFIEELVSSGRTTRGQLGLWRKQ